MSELGSASVESYQTALTALEQFLSPAVARALLTRALKDEGLSASRLNFNDLPRLRQSLHRGVRLFVESDKRTEAERVVTELCGSPSSQTFDRELSILIRSEADIGTARARARTLCTELGADPFLVQKAATVVSELVRNMILYAGGGELSLIIKAPERGQKKRFVIVASDEGPGIKNLATVLSGDYKSRTGLGRGLLGTKRLAQSFDVETGEGGTKVTAELEI